LERARDRRPALVRADGLLRSRPRSSLRARLLGARAGSLWTIPLPGSTISASRGEPGAVGRDRPYPDGNVVPAAPLPRPRQEGMAGMSTATLPSGESVRRAVTIGA